jgi:hypothetical protein
MDRWMVDGWMDVLSLAQVFFYLCGDFTITSEGLQNLGLCSTLLRGIFIVPHLL